MYMKWPMNIYHKYYHYRHQIILFEKQENNSLYKHYFSYQKIIQSSHYKVDDQDSSQTRIV